MAREATNQYFGHANQTLLGIRCCARPAPGSAAVTAAEALTHNSRPNGSVSLSIVSPTLPLALKCFATLLVGNRTAFKKRTCHFGVIHTGEISNMQPVNVYLSALQQERGEA